MDAIKNSLKAVKSVFEGVPFFKFMMTAAIFIFAGGGLLWLISGFLPMMSFGGYFVKTLLASLGRIAIFVGLGFTLIKGEDLFSMITSAVISLGALIAAIIEVAVYGYSNFELWLFFALFGGLTALSLIAFLSSDKMKEMKAQAQVRAQERAAAQAAAAAAAQQAAAAAAAQQAAAAAAQVQLIECPNCKGPVPINAKFCPNCGAPNPAMQYQQAPPAPPAAPPQAPPAAPEAPPAAPEAPPAAPEAPPAAPEAPPAAPEAAPEAPLAAPEAPPQAPPAAPEAPATKSCAACGAQIPASAVFCGQCGAKQ